ncbi:hypothetical protein FHS27_003489 [Rhodopirellula rubra]|uniref:Transmembrane protein n=1 Tax=Aporhodopirellula rubra TaxID=980271 RepID=A0A7W5E0T0_9BACT|nr:hypothetical protein [Aporhodopirellula rubra]MBB3207664.1 hypothetical protein [Aporhodopirellula rubra]
MSNDPNSNDPFTSPSSAISSRTGRTSTTLSEFLRVGQLISFALTSGIITMTAVFAFLMMQNDEEAAEGEMVLLLIGGGVFVMALVTAFLMRMMLRSAAASKLRTEPEVAELVSGGVAASQPARDAWENWDRDETLPRPLRQYLEGSQTSRLVSQAILEGAAVVNLVLSMLDGNALHFAAVIVCLVGVISLTPTLGKIRSEIRSAFSVAGVSGEFIHKR